MGGLLRDLIFGGMGGWMLDDWPGRLMLPILYASVVTAWNFGKLWRISRATDGLLIPDDPDLPTIDMKDVPGTLRFFRLLWLSIVLKVWVAMFVAMGVKALIT